jgi:hypothetical protein
MFLTQSKNENHQKSQLMDLGLQIQNSLMKGLQRLSLKSKGLSQQDMKLG